MARLLKITMDMTVAVVQVVPADTEVGPLSKDDIEDIKAAAIKEGTGDPAKTITKAEITQAEVVEV